MLLNHLDVSEDRIQIVEDGEVIDLVDAPCALSIFLGCTTETMALM